MIIIIKKKLKEEAYSINTQIIPRAGEIWLGEIHNANGNQYLKERPWIIISNDRNNLYSGMVNAIPLTTKRNGKHLPMHVPIRAGEVEGVYRDSVAAVESSMPIEKINFSKKIGAINEKIEYEICDCFAIQIPMLQKWLDKKIQEEVCNYERKRVAV